MENNKRILKETLHEEIKKLKEKDIEEIITNMSSKFDFKHTDESEIVRSFMEEKISTIFDEMLKDFGIEEQPHVSFPQIDLALYEIEGNFLTYGKQKIEELVSPETYRRVRDAIRNEIEGGCGIVVLIGAGISDAPRKIRYIAEQILRENGITPEKYDYDFSEEYSSGWYNGWHLLEEYRSDFVNHFNNEAIFADVEATIAQKKIANLYCKKKIRQLVIFNWDNLVEAAYMDQCPEGERLSIGKEIFVYNRVPSNIKIQERHIWHPHGYIGDKGVGYLLPHEGGFLPTQLKDYCKKGFHGTFLIIGFRDENHKIIRDFLDELESNGKKIIRVKLDEKPHNLTINFDGDRFLNLLEIWIEN